MSFWRWHNENEPKRGYWHQQTQEVKHVPTASSNSTVCSSASRLSRYEGQDGRFHRTHHTHHRHRHHRGHGHHHHHHHRDNHHDHHDHHHHGHHHHGHHHHGHHHRYYRYRTYPRRRYQYRNSDSAHEHVKRGVRAVDTTLTPTTDSYGKHYGKTEWCSREGRYVHVGYNGRGPVKYTKRVYPVGKPYETVKVVEKPVGYKHVERTVSRPVHKDYVKTVQRHENGRGYGVVRRWEYVEPVIDAHGNRVGHKHVSHRSHSRHRTHYPYEYSDYTHHRHSRGYSHAHPRTHGYDEHR